jgi:hypothetical protein
MEVSKMGTLSTSARAAHELALAAGFGSSMYSSFGLRPAEAQMSVHDKRRLGRASWRTYRWLSAASLALTAGSWILGRTMFRGFEPIGRRRPGLLLAKDILIGGAVASGIATLVLGEQLDRVASTGFEGPRAEVLEKALAIVSYANMALFASVIGVTTALGSRASRIIGWPTMSRFSASCG